MSSIVSLSKLMRPKNFPFLGLFTAGLALALLSQAALAQTVVAPNGNAGVEGSGSNNFPFNIGSFAASERFQQVYLASQFGAVGIGGGFITQIVFRPDGPNGAAFASILPSAQINLSTTGASPSTLSSTFAANVGANDQIVFGPGALSLSSSNTGPAGGPKSFDITITFSTPFFYNPSLGNLLLDVRINNFGGMVTTPFDFETSSALGFVATVGSGVNSPTADAVVNTGGLVTQFGFVPVPEPTSIGLFGVGLFAFCGVWLRARTKSPTL